MQGYRFYADYASKADKRRREHTGNVVAVCTDVKSFWNGHTMCREAATAIFDRPDSPVCGSAVSVEYLWTRCRRISEAAARKIHPEMFRYLDD